MSEVASCDVLTVAYNQFDEVNRCVQARMQQYRSGSKPSFIFSVEKKIYFKTDLSSALKSIDGVCFCVDFL